jgi:hypothetical protein
MTLDEIGERVEVIRRFADDPESAHSDEDELRARFIAYVAGLTEPDPELAEKARVVLSTGEFDFPRWCA